MTTMKVTMDENCKLIDVDGARAKALLFFPMEDTLEFLSVAVVKATQANAAVDPAVRVRIAEDVIPLTTGLWPELITAIEEVESKILEGGQAEACAQCNQELAARNMSPCPGILEKGDLLKAIVGTALRIGLVQLFEMLEKGMLGDGPTVQASSVLEFFGPALSQILNDQDK